MSDSATVLFAEDPSTTRFEQFVVLHIQKILDGQARLERRLIKECDGDKYDEGCECDPVAEQDLLAPCTESHTSLVWKQRDDSDDDGSVRVSHGFRKVSITQEQSIHCMKSQRVWPDTLAASWPKSLRVKAGRQGVHDNEEEVTFFRERFESLLAKDDWHPRHTIESVTLGMSAKRWSLVLMPTHPLRLLLDTLCMVCLGVDLITIPYILAWDVESRGMLRITQFVIMLYWSIDILFSFLSAYLSEGKIVADFNSIALNYLRKGFTLDLLVVVIDWLSFCEAFTSAESTNMAKAMRVGKLARLFRVVAVFRMSRVSKAYYRLVDYCTVKGFTLILTMFEVLKLLVVIVYINHVLGCIWFALAKYAHPDTGASWLDTQIVGRRETYRDSNHFFQYTSVFHWSLTQMTPGSMQLQAQNSPERVFNIMCLVFGVLFFGTLLSTLSAKMMDVKKDTERKLAMKRAMMKFLQQRHVCARLILLVKSQVEARTRVKPRLTLHSIDAFGFLSGKLLSEVHIAICWPPLCDHPLFVVMCRLCKDVSREVCFRAMEFKPLNQNDRLFAAGDHCSEAFVISEGTVVYTQEPGCAFVLETTTCYCQTGTWFCEAALWSDWLHLGTVDCPQTAEALKISSDKLMVAITMHCVLNNLMLNYGRAYHKRLISVRHVETLTDLSNNAVRSVQILSHLGDNLKAILNSMSLKIFYESYGWYGSTKWRRLSDETRLKKTALVPITDKQVLRCVQVSCLKLARDDGCILAEVGSWNADTGSIKPHINLPGSKMNNGEEAEVALERMLKEDLGKLGSVIVLLDRTEEHTLRTSGSYMVDTDYTKHVFEASLNPELKLASWLTGSQSLSKEGNSTVVFYVSEDAHQRKQVYVWMSPDTFDSARDGQLDMNRLLRDFDVDKAMDLKALSIFEDVNEKKVIDMKLCFEEFHINKPIDLKPSSVMKMMLT